MADPVGVSVAFDDGPFVADPTWTQLDLDDHLVAGYTIRRGRQTEFERTATGTATIALNDTGGLTPADFDGKQAAITLHNPVDDTWSSLFRGLVDEYAVRVEPTQNVARVAVTLVDGLDYLAGFELRPGVDGDSAPLSGTLFYEEGTSTVGDTGERIHKVLDDVGWFSTLSGLRIVFTGNVRVQKTVYSPGTSALTVIDECAEAEFPQIANRFVDKNGAFVFHGRLARFSVEDYESYGITTWKVGDGAAIADDPDYTQMRGLTYSRSRDFIKNSSLITPMGIADADIPGQLTEDTGSQDSYGLRSFNAADLRILNSALTGNDANEECRLFSDYFVTVYNSPQTRVNQITFRSIHPDDDRAANVWNLLQGVDISDRIQLKCGTPDGGFDDELFFVEGITYTVDPLQPEYQNVTLTLDLSPGTYYPEDFPWVEE